MGAGSSSIDAMLAKAAQDYRKTGGASADVNTSVDQPDNGSYLQKLGKGLVGLAGGALKTGYDAGRFITGIDPSGTAGQDLYNDVVQPQVDQAKQARDLWNQGEHSQAVGHGIAAVTPFAGPAAAKIGDEAGAGDWSGAAADATVLGGAMALPHAPAIAKRLKGTPIAGDVADSLGSVGALTRVDPDTALHQAAPWRVSGPEFMERAPIARGDVKLAAGNTPINDLPTAKRMVGNAKAINRAVFDMHVDPYRQAGVQIPLDQVGDAIEDSIPAELRITARTDPTSAQQIQGIRQYANSFRGQTADIDTFRKLAEETNAQLNGFYHKTADAQNAAITSQGGVATLEAKAQAYRRIMRQAFGDDTADIQRRWGYLDDFDSALDAGYRRMLNEKPVSPSVTAQRMASIPGKVAHGDIEGGINSIRGKTNSLIKRAFDATEPGAPLPTPMPGQGLGGMPTAAPPSRQLPPATPRVGPPGSSGSSYVSTSGMPPGQQMNAWQGIGGQRQLPAAHTPFTQGASAINPQAMPRGGPRLLPPGSPAQGQGVIQVPPPGMADWQVPPSPRTAATPPDTSSVRAVPGEVAIREPNESIATRIGKQVRRAVGGPPIE